MHANEVVPTENSEPDAGEQLVEIGATPPLTVGVNVTENEVNNLPLNGRQVSQLYLLTPGAVNNGTGTFDNIRFSGRANQQNAIRYDGVEGSARPYTPASASNRRSSTLNVR